MSKQNKNTSTESALWGIDMGGTKIEGVVLKSAADPQVIFRDRVPTEADQGYEHIISQTKLLVDMMKTQTGLTQRLSVSVHPEHMIRKLV
jgi:fructokinase